MVLNNMITKTFIGTLARANTLTEQSKGSFSFTSKHGNNLSGGRARDNFELIFEFE